MSRWSLRLGLSLIVTVSTWTTRLPAGPQAYIPTEVMLVPVVPYAPALHPPYPLTLESQKTANPPGPPRTFLQRMLNPHGVDCQDNRYGNSGNFYSEMRWMYGSSRNFFGDICYPNGPCFGKNGAR